jgi:3-oxoacyl-[acyl-carrier protein] reductase
MKTVFVTGASRGIGKSIALELGKDYQVVVGFSNSQDKADEVVEEIKKLGGKSLAVQLNIGDRTSVDNAFLEIEEIYDQVDILVNNAGITKDNILPRMKDEE